MTIIINGVKCLKKGVKDSLGKYCPVSYSHQSNYGDPGQLSREAITIYAKDYSKHLPKELGPVKNGTDSMTDYFEKDRLTFYAGSPEFAALLPLVVDKINIEKGMHK